MPSGSLAHERRRTISELLPFPPGACSALAVIDMQEFYFTKPERRKGLDMVIFNINALIDHFDSQGFPVIHVLTSYKADGSDWDLKMRMSGRQELIEGSLEASPLPGISVLPGHTVISKTRYSAFHKTNLIEILQEQHVRRLVVTGAYTHYCVNATVFDAFAYDFVPCLITDAVISHLPEESMIMIDRMRRNGFHVFQTEEYLTQF
jgi:nicotinamidase-related amidase